MGNIYKNDVQQGILTHDCVSFDLFQTLVMRRVPMASDVYVMVEQRLTPTLPEPFSVLRMRAERELRAQGVAPSFESIYRYLRELTGLDEREATLLMQEERKVEQEVWLARRDVADMLRMAHDSGKTVTILADTYMRGERIRTLLDALDITFYDHLLSAADVGLTRETGLYAHYRETVCGDRRALHIGDDPVKDGDLAQANGLDAIILPRALDQYRRDNPDAALPQDPSARRILGEKIARQYNSPFA